MAEPDDVVVVSAPFVPGMRIERVLGLTWGVVVRSRGLGYQLAAGLRSLAGGEIREFTEMLSKTRQEALDRMKAHAAALGANAVIAAAFDSSELGGNMSEILAYGTAVVVVPEKEQPEPVHLV